MPWSVLDRTGPVYLSTVWYKVVLDWYWASMPVYVKQIGDFVGSHHSGRTTNDKQKGTIELLCQCNAMEAEMSNSNSNRAITSSIKGWSAVAAESAANLVTVVGLLKKLFLEQCAQTQDTNKRIDDWSVTSSGRRQKATRSVRWFALCG